MNVPVRKRCEPLELDLDCYELRRGGRKVSIQRQPMELLIYMVQHQGRLVTREELIHHLWGDAVSLDAERSLNTAINKIRRALGDDADEPRFLQTVVGKGYRFVVQTAASDGDESAVQFRVILPNPQRPKGDEPAAHPPEPEGRVVNIPAFESRQRRWLVAMAVGAVFVAGVAVALRRDPPKPLAVEYRRLTNDGRKKAHALGELPIPLVSDANRVYYSVLNAAGRELGHVSIAGGDTAGLATSLPLPVPLNMSRDGSRLLVISPADLPEAPLWIQPLPAGPPQRVGNLQAQSAAWSPDEKLIAFASATGLHLARHDGSLLRTLIPLERTSGEHIYWPRWSPDGQVLRFTRFSAKTGEHALMELRLHPGATPRRLPEGWASPARECCGEWSTDGSSYLFVSWRTGRSDIWTMREGAGFLSSDFAAVAPVTSGPLSYYSPLPQADGSTLVLGVETRGQLVRHDPKSGALLPWLGGISATGVSYSADGRYVAYTSLADKRLWRSKADGTDRVQLTDAPMRAILPRWSPDGKRIAFYARAPGQRFQIYVVDSSGGVPTALPADERHHQIDPTWSPDGASIVFEKAPWDARGRERRTELNRFVLATGEVQTIPGSAGKVSPRWSPDGRYIAAMTADSGALLLFDTAAKTWRELLHLRIGYPNWSTDSRYLYFDRFDQPAGVSRVRVRDGMLELLVPQTTEDPLWTIDSWTGLNAANEVLLVRDASVQEIFSFRQVRK